ncbi:MAG: hypothetical protein QOD99_338 [Chthoniobacter sp.]|jgi:uncharacterized alpha-E superfamily protein|nr:hypothetical protein [Chthoniobacter sp.]
MLSRVADSLYWLNRYMERAENSARILDVNLQLMLDFQDGSEGIEKRQWEPIIASLEDQKLFQTLHDETNAETVCEFVTFERENPNSIYSCLLGARENARTVREYISSEMWEQINQLYLYMKSDAARQDCANSGIDFYRRLVSSLHQFLGITNATLTHGEGWNFLQVGKYIERADCTSRILDLKYHILLPSGERVGGNVDTVQWMAVLKSCSALEAYRKLYVGQVAPWKVAEFIILHDDFPRSIRFCVDGLDTALHRISGCDRSHFTNDAERLSGRLCSILDYETIAGIFQVGLHQYLDRIQLRLIELAAAMTKTYCEWLEPEPAVVEAGAEQTQTQGA